VSSAVVLSDQCATIACVIIDLHAHTRASDGSCTPTQVIEWAVARGVEVVAITDHDTVAGLPEAIAAGQAAGVTVIPGVELSVTPPQGQLHIVAYLPTPDPRPLMATLRVLQAARERRAEAMVARLAALGVPVEMAQVRKIAGGSLGRPHLADALVAAGHATDRGDAFARFLGDDAPAYIPHRTLTPRKTLELVAGAGGIASLAHPGSLRMSMRQLESYVAHLKHIGLWGIEVYRAEHTPDQRDGFMRIARRIGLIATGGSDFHGPDAGRHELGDTGTPLLPAEVADLIDRALTKSVASRS
jgi:predicted metal-dependent phosphoesterase TrpH